MTDAEALQEIRWTLNLFALAPPDQVARAVRELADRDILCVACQQTLEPPAGVVPVGPDNPADGGRR